MSGTIGPDATSGYRRPPAGAQYKPGQSGNPKRRPRGRHHDLPYEAVLGQPVTIREDGVERRVTAAEAFLLHMTKTGLAGNGAAGRAALEAIEAARATRGIGDNTPRELHISFVDPVNVTCGLRALRMATKIDRFRPSIKILLEPWLVQAALARLGKRTLTDAEQAEVFAATRTPHKVRWPAWWTASWRKGEHTTGGCMPANSQYRRQAATDRSRVAEPRGPQPPNPLPRPGPGTARLLT